MLFTTPSSIIRDWNMDDLPSLVRHADNKNIAAWMRDGFSHPYTTESGMNFIKAATNNPDNLFLAIEVEHEAVGGVGVHLLSDVYRKTGEIGYWLSEEYWGRGIITDAVRTLVPLVFERYDIIRLQAGVYEENHASMRILEKCGFIREAVHKKAICKNGKIMDEYLYTKFRDEE